MTAGMSRPFYRTLLQTLFILAVFVIVASYFFVLLMGYGFIFFTSEGLTYSMRSFNFPVLLFFFLIGFFTPELPVGAVFASILVVFVFCFIAAWRWRESFHSVLGTSFSRPFRGLFSNFLFIMPLLSAMVLTAAWAIIYSQEFLGVPTGLPSFPADASSQEIFFNLAYAVVIEDLAFRLVPIGLFTIFLVFLGRRSVAHGGFKLFITALFYPEGAKKVAGLRNVSEHGIWRGISGGEWAMVLATSVIHAFAHIISGSGWEIGKITSAFVQGFFFAVTYLAYGFEAPILLHWFFNYYLFFFDSDVLSKFFPATEPILSIVELLILALGVAGWSVFAAAGLQRLTRRRRTKQVVPASATLPS